jgi:hypothetical protein
MLFFDEGNLTSKTDVFYGQFIQPLRYEMSEMLLIWTSKLCGELSSA